MPWIRKLTKKKIGQIAPPPLSATNGLPGATTRLGAIMALRGLAHTVRYTEMSPDRFRDFWKD